MYAPALRQALRGVSCRSFSTSRAAFAGKESALNEDADARKSKIEQHKQEQLKDSGGHQGKWRDELASDSESIVKADRGDLKDTKSTIDELQRETAKVAEKDKQEGRK